MQLVRLKPYQPRKGYKTQRYMYRGVKFTQEGGWYRIESDAFAEELRGLRQDENDPDSPDLFDVKSAEAALETQRAEAVAKGKAPAQTPNATRTPRKGTPPKKGGTVTTADIRVEKKDDEDPELEEALSEALADMPENGDLDPDETPEAPDAERVIELGRIADPIADPEPKPAPAPRGGGRSRSTRAAT